MSGIDLENMIKLNRPDEGSAARDRRALTGHSSTYRRTRNPPRASRVPTYSIVFQLSETYVSEHLQDGAPDRKAIEGDIETCVTEAIPDDTSRAYLIKPLITPGSTPSARVYLAANEPLIVGDVLEALKQYAAEGVLDGKKPDQYLIGRR
jgi:hypothetical protein